MIDPVAIANYSIAGFSIYLIYKLFKYVLCDLKRAIRELQNTIERLNDTIDRHTYVVERLINNGRREH